MTPERLLEHIGPASVKALDRYLRLLDLPLLRRLPIVRNLVAYREKSPAEAVALAANYLGQLIQRAARRRLLLRRPARHPLASGIPRPLRCHDRQRHAKARQTTALAGLGVPRRLPARPGRRLPETLSRRRRQDPDASGLAGDHPRRRLSDPLDARCLVPENCQPISRLLRTRGRGPVCHPHQGAEIAPPRSGRRVSQPSGSSTPSSCSAHPTTGIASQSGPGTDEEGERNDPTWFENRELAFLRNVRLLYQDYLDGSPLHRSDTKASVQLLGNLRPEQSQAQPPGPPAA